MLIFCVVDPTGYLDLQFCVCLVVTGYLGAGEEVGRGWRRRETFF
jgi:hypothetical protein